MHSRFHTSLGVAGAVLLAGLLAWALLERPTPIRAAESATPADAARATLANGVDSLLASLAELSPLLDQKTAAAARRSYLRARTAYKRVESLLTLTDPLVSGWLNGPPAEDEDDFPRPPGVTGGFQVIEATLFPDWDAETAQSARPALTRMRNGLAAARMRLPQLPLYDAEVLDAARLEVARVSTLGLAGFDTDGSGAAIGEAADAFEGMRAFNAALPLPDSGVDHALAVAAAYLRSHRDFEQFNRLEFLVGYAAPAARAVAAARSRLPHTGPRRQRAWRVEAATVFDPAAFDPGAFGSFDTPPPSKALVQLGKRLFFDPRLSGPQNRSCSTCHDPARGFTDGRSRSPLLGSGETRRNTPTLWNAAYQPVLFLDQRASSLEAQVDSVLANREEMASSTRLVADRLRDDSAVRAAFSAALPGRPEAGVTPGSIRMALAAYVRSLTAMNSRFDRAVRGDTLAMAARERHGFTLFMGKARCGTCHFLPFFNGTAPPLFASSEGEIIGVPERAVTSGARLDPDSGRGRVDQLPEHLFAFKVPSLRNVALTSPYMHNGAYQTLEQVVDFYDRGGGAGIGAEVPGQTLPARRLHLTLEERRDLIAFMGALTDTVPAPGY